MPSLDPLHPLQSALIEVLAEKPQQSIAMLRERVKEKYQLGTALPTLYRTLRLLLEKQILVRDRGKISLNLVWVSHAQNIMSSMAETYLATNTVTTFHLTEGERREFGADSLSELDPLWNDILMKVTQATEQQQWYEYDSHPYYALGMPETEIRLYQGLANRGIHCTVLHGNNTFLDRFGCKFLTMPSVAAYTKENVPFPKEGYIVFVCGEYLIECLLPVNLTHHFSFFFQNITAMDQFDAELFAMVFRMKIRCKISVRRDKDAARMFQEKILLSIRTSSEKKADM